MDINAAKQVLLRTHTASIRHGERANGVHLESGPGIGKSDGVAQYAEDLAKETGRPVGLVTFMLATIASVDVRGFMMPVKLPGGTLDTVFSTPPWFPTHANTAVVEPNGAWHTAGSWPREQAVPEVGVLFLDEFSQAEDEVKKPAAELVYKGTVGTTALPKGWRVVAAGNRLSDRSGVMRELMFIVNRRCKLSIDASLPAWLNWASAQAPGKRPHYLAMSFAQKNPDIVFKDSVPEGSDPFCTPRTLCLMDRDLMALRSDEDERKDRFPTDALAREVMAGWIGGASAAQLMTHIKYADELPDMADIIKDPNKAKLPPNRDAQMVAGYMLAHNVDEKTAGPVIKYIKRLQIEMQVLAMRSIGAQQDRARTIVSQPEYVQWLMQNKDLIVASRQ